MSTGMRMDRNEVGGAIVTRAFQHGEVRKKLGERLTRDEVLNLPERNREALVSSKIIREVPLAVAADLPEGERFVVRRTDLRYDVVQGVRVNSEPLSKAEAIALAGGVPE